MSYYLSILEKYKISDLETFENVKNRYPRESPSYLRKIIYLKGFKISKDGMLSSANQEKTSNKKIMEYFHCPECWSTRWVWIDGHSRIMCLDCGFVGARSALIMKEQEKQIYFGHRAFNKKKRKKSKASIREEDAQSKILFWVKVNSNKP